MGWQPNFQGHEGSLKICRFWGNFQCQGKARTHPDFRGNRWLILTFVMMYPLC